MPRITLNITDGRFKLAITIWIIVFTFATGYAIRQQREIQQQGRKDRIATATGLAQTQATTAVRLANAQIKATTAIKAANAKQNQALKAGLVLVCTKSLGVISGIIALSVTGSTSHPVHLTRGQQIAINTYLGLANPKQCSTLVNPVK